MNMRKTSAIAIAAGMLLTFSPMAVATAETPSTESSDSLNSDKESTKDSASTDKEDSSAKDEKSDTEDSRDSDKKDSSSESKVTIMDSLVKTNEEAVKTSQANLQTAVADGANGDLKIQGESHPVYSASIIKVGVAAAALKNGKGEEQDLNLMITKSDNDATNRLIDAVGGFDAVNKVIGEAGVKGDDFKLANKMGGTEYLSRASAQGAGTILQQILKSSEGNNDEFLKKEDAQKIIDLMKKQTVNTKLGQGLETGKEVAHKTGEHPDAKVSHDIGYLFAGDKTYVIADLTDGNFEAGTQEIASISSQYKEDLQADPGSSEKDDSKDTKDDSKKDDEKPDSSSSDSSSKKPQNSSSGTGEGIVPWLGYFNKATVIGDQLGESIIGEKTKDLWDKNGLSTIDNKTTDGAPVDKLVTGLGESAGDSDVVIIAISADAYKNIKSHNDAVAVSNAIADYANESQAKQLLWIKPITLKDHDKELLNGINMVHKMVKQSNPNNMTVLTPFNIIGAQGATNEGTVNEDGQVRMAKAIGNMLADTAARSGYDPESGSSSSDSSSSESAPKEETKSDDKEDSSSDDKEKSDDSKGEDSKDKDSDKASKTEKESPEGTVNKDDWEKLAECESGGDWSINTGNSFSGGVQFTDQSWESFGGTKYADHAYEASKEEQMEIANKVLEGQGWGAWPGCTSKLGSEITDKKPAPEGTFAD